MSAQHAYKNMYSLQELEYHAEESKKRLKYAMANFAQVRFMRSMKMQMSLTEDK